MTMRKGKQRGKGKRVEINNEETITPSIKVEEWNTKRLLSVRKTEFNEADVSEARQARLTVPEQMKLGYGKNTPYF